MPELTLIISFYNKPHNLKLVIASLEVQTFKAFEVIIADDGSSDEIVKIVQSIISSSSLDIKHIWHEDKGWRKNRILNKAILSSNTDYLVFIDGDCILHPEFMEEHYDHREKNYVIAGRRVNLSKKISENLTPEKISKGYLWGRYRLWILVEGLIKKNTHFENSFYFKNPLIRRFINKKDKGILGAHFSIYKDDIVAVNGFDERYLAPAVGEDTDLEYRLRQNGMKIKTLKHIAIQYHIYHRKLFRDERNQKIFEETKRKGLAYTPYGLSQ